MNIDNKKNIIYDQYEKLFDNLKTISRGNTKRNFYNKNYRVNNRNISISTFLKNNRGKNRQGIIKFRNQNNPIVYLYIPQTFLGNNASIGKKRAKKILDIGLASKIKAIRVISHEITHCFDPLLYDVKYIKQLSKNKEPNFSDIEINAYFSEIIWVIQFLHDNNVSIKTIKRITKNIKNLKNDKLYKLSNFEISMNKNYPHLWKKYVKSIDNKIMRISQTA